MLLPPLCPNLCDFLPPFFAAWPPFTSFFGGKGTVEKYRKGSSRYKREKDAHVVENINMKRTFKVVVYSISINIIVFALAVNYNLVVTVLLLQPYVRTVHCSKKYWKSASNKLSRTEY